MFLKFMFVNVFAVLIFHRWEWTRDSASLAAGKIVGSTYKESKLMLINLVPGQYSFKLQVFKLASLRNIITKYVHS